MWQRVHNADPFDLISCLQEELLSQGERDRRVPLLFALYRVLECSKERGEEAAEILERLRRLAPADEDTIWESLRASLKRDPGERLTALTAVSGILEYPNDIIHAHLLAAEILSEQLGETSRALKEIDAIRKIAPKMKSLLLASARTRAFSTSAEDDPSADLESFARVVTDSAVRSALFFEIAEARRLAGADPAAVSALLEEAMAASSDPHWTVVDGVMRTAEKIEDWRLCEKAAAQLAEAALSPSTTETPEKPVGHGFRGFIRSESEASAWYWYLAQIRERRLKDLEGALDALEKAQALMPRNRLFKLERARLLGALDRPEAAFAAIPEDAAFSELAVAALAAGKHEEAVYLASLERESRHSLFAEILMDSLHEDTPPPLSTAPPALLQLWFDSHPGHPGAAAAAEALRPHIDVAGVVWLYLEEHAAADGPITDIANPLRPDPWSHALNAVLGSGADRVEAFVRWAETTVDDVLKNTLLRTALLLAKDAPGGNVDVNRLVSRIDALDESRRDADASPIVSLAGNEAEDAAGRYLRALNLLSECSQDGAADAILQALETEGVDTIFAGLLRMDIAAREGAFDRFARCVTGLISRIDGEGTKLHLFAGELLLALNQGLENALSFLDAAETVGGETAGIARIYRLLVLHLQGEHDAVARAVAESEIAAKSELESFFAFEDPTDDGFDAALQLEGMAELPVFSKLSKILSIFEDEALPSEQAAKDAAACLLETATLLPSEVHARAFRIAASLLDADIPRPLDTDPSSDESDEYLCRLDDAASASISQDATAYHRSQAEKVLAADVFEWVDRMLWAAEIAAEIEGPAAALSIVNEALAVSPEHPGLLEAEVRYAYAAGNYVEAADTRGRLARFYISQDEKVHQLAQAALILLDKLQNPEGARNIINEAKRRNPGHAEADEVLRHIQSTLGAAASESSARSDEAVSQGQSEMEAKKAAGEASEKHIAMLISARKWQEAMDAVNQLLMRSPDRPGVHRMRLDLLTREKRWEEAVAAAEGYFNTATNREERRSVVFRAASIAEDVLKDPRLAVAWLLRLRDVGDAYAEAEKRIREIALKGGFEDEIPELPQTPETGGTSENTGGKS